MLGFKRNNLAHRIAQLEAELGEIERKMQNSATLVSLTKLDARRVQIVFIRNGSLIDFEFYSSLDFDLAAARKALLENG